MPAAADEDEPAAAAAVTSAAGNVASGTEGGCEPCVRSVTLQGVAAHGGEGTGGGPVPGKGMRAGETGERGEGAAGGTTVPQACDAAVSVGGDASGGRGIGVGGRCVVGSGCAVGVTQPQLQQSPNALSSAAASFSLGPTGRPPNTSPAGERHRGGEAQRAPCEHR